MNKSITDLKNTFNSILSKLDSIKEITESQYVTQPDADKIKERLLDLEVLINSNIEKISDRVDRLVEVAESKRRGGICKETYPTLYYITDKVSWIETMQDRPSWRAFKAMENVYAGQKEVIKDIGKYASDKWIGQLTTDKRLKTSLQDITSVTASTALPSILTVDATEVLTWVIIYELNIACPNRIYKQIVSKWVRDLETQTNLKALSNVLYKAEVFQDFMRIIGKYNFIIKIGFDTKDDSWVGNRELLLQFIYSKIKGPDITVSSIRKLQMVGNDKYKGMPIELVILYQILKEYIEYALTGSCRTIQQQKEDSKTQYSYAIKYYSPIWISKISSNALMRADILAACGVLETDAIELSRDKVKFNSWLKNNWNNLNNKDIIQGLLSIYKGSINED